MSGSDGFADHFSGHAADYAAARPTYPRALFDWLALLGERNEAAWDCATGNGQAAAELARDFPIVYATDASEQQIANAVPAERVHYRVATAERSGLDDASVDLVAVAQALHWFDFGAFFAEVRRVLRPGGHLVAWGYELARVAPGVDALIDAFYGGSLHPYWPPERRHIETGYREIPFPFAKIDTPEFVMELDWTAEAMLAYLRTWSAVQRYRADRGSDPVDAIANDLRTEWGRTARRVEWPLQLLAGRI